MTHAPTSAQALPAPAHPLVCHPANPCALPLRIAVGLAMAARDGTPGLQLHYTLQGDTTRLRLPPPAEPGPADGLWQHTCFEAFVGTGGDSAYREFNFAPSGQWAAYRFSAERQRDTAAETAHGPVRPVIEAHTRADGLQLIAWLPMSALPNAQPGQTLLVGLTAVIETTDGALSYWALQHPAERPDFHHRGGWRALPDIPALLSPDPTP